VATYTTPTADDIKQICVTYPITLKAFQPLDGGAANSSYHLDCAEGEFVLTVLDNHNHDSAENLACLLSFLGGHHIPIPTVQPTIDGALRVSHGHSGPAPHASGGDTGSAGSLLDSPAIMTRTSALRERR
jgi:Ser/Thr protein kinase RdoA (MazF antagonist)